MEFSAAAPSPAALTRLSAALVHRGPDDQGQLIHRNVGLVFRRLAIIDLSAAGHQPMLDASGRYAIVFNGEIFNYIELRRELEGKGHVFRSSSDTEVLLHAYIEWKQDCLRRLNGMWAFVILDMQRNECFCARDRFGVKPLYLAKSRERMILASEVSAIARSGLHDLRINRKAVAQYLYFGDLDREDETFCEGIAAVTPGTWLAIDANGGTRSGRYFELPEDTNENPDPSELGELFHDSVRLRLRSDVPVGVFLSGGMDSTSILCEAAAQRGAAEPLQAYAFMSPDYDETRYIGDTLRQTGANLVPLEVDDSGLWQRLERMVGHQDGPVHTPSALIGFCLCELAASRGTKVVLNGQGADETLAGYPSYFPSYWQSLLGAGQWRRLRAQLAAYGAHHGIGTSQLLQRVFALWIRIQLNRLGPYRWMAALRHQRVLRGHALFNGELVDSLPRYRQHAGAQGIGEALRRSVTSDPLPLYLRVEDRNSMAHSIEARLPFLDHRLVEAVMGIVGTRKMEGYWNKVLLREAMRGRIPESVRTRPDKMGFETPDAKWIRAWAPQIEGLFRSTSFAQRGYFNVANLLAALKLHVEGVRHRHEELFRAVQVELYLRHLQGGTSAGADAEPGP